MKLWVSAFVLVMLCASPVLAQNVLRVPEDYSTIQEAANMAVSGDTIRVGPGIYCGAMIGKKLTILGEDQATITACIGVTAGFSVLPNASGTTIKQFNFSGLTTGIWALVANDVTVEHNTMQLTGSNAVGINSYGGGSDWTVRHNTISVEASNGRGMVNWLGSGWTVSHNNLTGTGLTLGIWFNRPQFSLPVSRAVNNTAEFNHIEGADDGVGIKITSQDGAVVRNNKIFMPSSSDAPPGVCGGWSIEVHDSRVYSSDQMDPLTSINSLIVNNDTRGTAVGVIVVTDRGGGTGNSAWNVLHGNFGTFAINQEHLPCTAGHITGEVKNRSISTLITCDENGICNDIPQSGKNK
jgi:hypothetical protein